MGDRGREAPGRREWYPAAGTGTPPCGPAVAVRRGAAALILGAPTHTSFRPGTYRGATAENNNEMQPATAPVTFLFTDIEGSTRLWEQEPERMQAALARHDALAPRRSRPTAARS